MSRQIFIHDLQKRMFRTYRVPDHPNTTDVKVDYFFTPREENPFVIISRCIDVNKPVYELVFENANNESWYVNIEPNNYGCKKISFDKDRVHLAVGIADHFPENGDPEFHKKASDRIYYIEKLHAEKDLPEYSEEETFNAAKGIEDEEKGNN